MKIAIMTWYTYVNYGTALQVTALSEYLTKNGHDVSVINYKHRELGMDVITSLNKRFWENFRKKIQFHFNKSVIEEKNANVFEQYVKMHLKTTKYCETQADLEKLNTLFDVFVCGSDQIWSPLCFDPHYFLDFVTEPSKMIAYAPSIGTSSIKNKDIKEKIMYLTGRFTYLSVREKTGAKILEDLLLRPVENTIDPTLLLTNKDWDRVLRLSPSENDKKYLLAYFLGKNKLYWKKTYDIAKKLNLIVKIIPVFENDYKRSGSVILGVEPTKFVSLIKNATFVCTDSFHGTAFSVNYNKNFCCFERFNKNDARNQNSRIYDFLDTVGLRDRLWSSGNIDNICSDIDYIEVNQKLQYERQKSKSYISKSIVDIGKSVDNKKKDNIFKYNSLCCGCGACALVCSKNAISVKMTDEGFYEAVVNDKNCISCEKCIQVCPIQNDTIRLSMKNGKLYSYKDSDKNVLKTSSSGGVAYRLAEQFLKQGYTVIGCMFDVKKQSAHHTIIYPGEAEKLFLLQGSKYMQSEFASTLVKIKNINSPLVIFGTPCEIAAARSILKNRNNVIYIDLICHGVPSYNLFKKYKKLLKNRNGVNTEKVNVIFRFKEKGWHNIYIYATDLCNQFIAHQSKDEYCQFFENGFCYSKACYECKWRSSTEADIRIGDYWGEKFVTDNTGVSMVMAMNECAEITLKEMLGHAGEFIKQPETDYFVVQQIDNYQRPIFYEKLMKELEDENTDLEKIYKVYCVPYEKWKNIMRRVHNLYGKIKRK